MKRKAKKAFKAVSAIAVAFALVFSALPVGMMLGFSDTAYAAEISESLYTYDVLNGEATIIACDMNAKGKITIPEVIGNAKVTAIADEAFAYCTNITEIEIPASIKKIACSAFNFCTGLSAFTVAEGNNNYSAFNGILYNKDKTEIVKYPQAKTERVFSVDKNIEKISEFAFNGCKDLERLDVSSENQTYASVDGVLFNKDKTSLIRFPEGSEKAEYVVPNGVAEIGRYAFDNCWNLNSVKLSADTQNVNDGAFRLCLNLKNIDLNKSLLTIGKNAFEFCASLTDVSFPNTVKTLGDCAFTSCCALKNIKLSNSLSKIGNWVFSECNSLESVNIPDTVKTIGDGAFSYSSSLKNVKLPAKLESIGAAAFEFCTGINYINIPKGAGRISSRAFNGISNLKVSIPQSVNYIGQNAFDKTTVIYGTAGSFAEKYANQNNIQFNASKLVEKIELQNTLELKVGDSFKLEAAVLPSDASNKNIKWTSLDEKVAKVDPQTGLVTGIAAGETIITAMAEDASGITAECKVTVLNNLKIVKQPEDFYGASGDNAVFEVTAQGDNLKYQWYYSNDNGKTWAVSGSAGNKTAKVSPVLREYCSGRLFKCLVTDSNKNSVWTDSATMALKHSEIIINKQPENYVGRINDLAIFTVDAQGENLNFDWAYSSDNGKTWERTFNEGHYTNSLKVRLYEYRDGWQYKCIITSGGVESAETNAVTIAKKPKTVKITEQPVNAGGKVGETVTFHVGAEGVGLTYGWEISKDSGETWSATAMEGANTDTLTVGIKSYRDGWMYRARVTDDSGSYIYTNVVTLRVGEAPKIIDEPKDASAPIGSKVVFTVNAKDAASYQWQYSNDNGKTWVNSGAQTSKTSTITVEVFPYRDGQLYRCVLMNDVGTVYTKGAKITVA